MEKILRTFSPSPLFSRLLNCFWKDCKYLGDSMVKVRYMVSCEGTPCFSVNIVFSSVWCSSAKLAMELCKNNVQLTLWGNYVVPFTMRQHF